MPYNAGYFQELKVKLNHETVINNHQTKFRMGSVHQRGIHQVRSGGVHRSIRPEVRALLRQHGTSRSRQTLVRRSVQFPWHLLIRYRGVRGVGRGCEGQRGAQTHSRWLVICCLKSCFNLQARKLNFFFMFILFSNFCLCRIVFKSVQILFKKIVFKILLFLSTNHAWKICFIYGTKLSMLT